MNFKNEQQKEQIRLIKDKEDRLFRGDKGGGMYRGKEREFVLKNWHNNFYKPLVDEALMKKYFAKNENDISWWGGKKPSRHTLSSQIACLNHLFTIRKDKEAVLAIARVICKDIDEVLEVPCDTEDTKAFIAFEVVSDTDYLKECKEGCKPTRGSNCTSIDAFILAKRGGQTLLLPIEWKYTEHYGNTNKATEDGKGDERLGRYSELIDTSKQLKRFDNYRSTVYFFEPFYQLMRQTLWAEQMVRYKDRERIKADDFIHVHVVPKDNAQLLKPKPNKPYKCSGEGMEATWHACLKEPNKYKRLSPKDLLADVDEKKHAALRKYLKERYWR